MSTALPSFREDPNRRPRGNHDRKHLVNHVIIDVIAFLLPKPYHRTTKDDDVNDHVNDNVGQYVVERILTHDPVGSVSRVDPTVTMVGPFPANPNQHSRSVHQSGFFADVFVEPRDLLRLTPGARSHWQPRTAGQAGGTSTLEARVEDTDI